MTIHSAPTRGSIAVAPPGNPFIGLNLRQTLAHATDPTSDIHVLASDSYPTTRSSVDGVTLTFGYPAQQPTPADYEGFTQDLERRADAGPERVRPAHQAMPPGLAALEHDPDIGEQITAQSYVRLAGSHRFNGGINLDFQFAAGQKLRIRAGMNYNPTLSFTYNTSLNFYDGINGAGQGPTVTYSANNDSASVGNISGVAKTPADWTADYDSDSVDLVAVTDRGVNSGWRINIQPVGWWLLNHLSWEYLP